MPGTIRVYYVNELINRGVVSRLKKPRFQIRWWFLKTFPIPQPNNLCFINKPSSKQLRPRSHITKLELIATASYYSSISWARWSNSFAMISIYVRSTQFTWMGNHVTFQLISRNKLFHTFLTIKYLMNLKKIKLTVKPNVKH